MTTYLHEFASWDEFQAAADAPCELPRDKQNSHLMSRDRTEFTGTESYAEASNLAINGCPAIEREIQAISDRLELAVGTTTTHTPFWDVAGDEVDVDRYLTGEPECMVSYPEREIRGHRQLRIAVQAAFSAGVPTHIIRTRGAAILALVDALETSGYRCEIVAAAHGCASYSSSNTLTTLIMIKRTQDHLDLTRLAYALAHPSMLRRHYFSYMERMTPDERRAFPEISSGYTCPPFTIPRETVQADIYVDDKDSFLSPFSTTESAANWVKALITKYTTEETDQP